MGSRTMRALCLALAMAAGPAAAQAANSASALKNPAQVKIVPPVVPPRVPPSLSDPMPAQALPEPRIGTPSALTVPYRKRTSELAFVGQPGRSDSATAPNVVLDVHFDEENRLLYRTAGTSGMNTIFNAATRGTSFYAYVRMTDRGLHGDSPRVYEVVNVNQD